MWRVLGPKGSEGARAQSRDQGDGGGAVRGWASSRRASCSALMLLLLARSRTLGDRESAIRTRSEDAAQTSEFS